MGKAGIGIRCLDRATPKTPPPQGEVAAGRRGVGCGAREEKDGTQYVAVLVLIS